MPHKSVQPSTAFPYSAAVLTSDFDFDLPDELIAQHPLSHRDQSRLLVLNRSSGMIEHREFRDITSRFKQSDVLVLNNSRVIPARLRGTNTKTLGEFEILLLEQVSANHWWAMMRPGKRARIGTRITLRSATDLTEIEAEVLETNAEGHRYLKFHGTENILNELGRLGEVPLPPYIRRDQTIPTDRDRYQTVFAQPPGSVAAPTAGLHFTDELLTRLSSFGVHVCFMTLHVGLGTFAPVKAERLNEHAMHEERFDVPQSTAEIINSAKTEGRRVVAVGTTTLRTLESLAAANHGKIAAGPGKTKIFIYPPYHFQIVDALLTNFHLPRSTLLMLVSAFAAPGKTTGRDLILTAYNEAIRLKYRFFSYGDAMLIE